MLVYLVWDIMLVVRVAELEPANFGAPTRTRTGTPEGNGF